MGHHIFDLVLHGKKEVFEFGKMAKQADGSVTLTCGETVMLAAISCDENAPADEDFLPLTVNYLERSYAAGKIPGGFFKREAKPSEFETLTSRIIDRTIRPLFPKGFNYPVVLTVMVLSSSNDADLQRMALLAAGAALSTSPLPVDFNIAAARIGKIDGELVVNPTLIEMENSTLDLFVAGTARDLLMIEMQTLDQENVIPVEQISLDPAFGATQEMMVEEMSTDMPEAELALAIELAGKALHESASMYNNTFKIASKPKGDYPLLQENINEEIISYIKSNEMEAIKSAVNEMAKTERSNALRIISKRVDEANEEWEYSDISKAVDTVKKEVVRSQILESDIRADGRACNEVRPITIETNILPKAHGSVLFTRGQTQALVVATIGGESDMQMSESLTSKQTIKDPFMLHYNFHGFCVNEAKPPRGPGRRELGHGNLARRAIDSQIPKSFDNTVRIVSEILESNGSSSMATVCGGSLSLRCADIPTKKLVAGVAMGLVTDGKTHKVLSDITGLEDHDGDMDFKVAGTIDGITAMQMDIKLGGVSKELLAKALKQAKEAREHILGIMEEANLKIQINSNALPKTEIFSIDKEKIVDVIGQGGKVIRDLIESFEVTIDLDRDKGGVKVMGGDSSLVDQAVAKIKDIVANSTGGKFGGRGGNKKENAPCTLEKGATFNGTIKKILEFGMLVELPDGNTGMVHISKIATGRINKIDMFNEGDKIDVIFLGQDPKKMKIELELKDKVQV